MRRDDVRKQTRTRDWGPGASGNIDVVSRPSLSRAMSRHALQIKFDPGQRPSHAHRGPAKSCPETR